ncbi:MAG: hypothetical protein Q9182_003772 [Xanthomendoza sp. 2 TL-2023]
MAENMPRRRSSRINSRGTTPSRVENTPDKLSSVLEREESPPQKLQNIDELLSSPTAPADRNSNRHYAIPGSFDTPPPAQRVHPGLNEMHPSKVHASTVKQPELIDAPNTAPVTTKPTGTIQSTPLKNRGTLPPYMSSPGFDFSFTRPESDLSEEAQKIMDSVREEAARIKAQMQAELNQKQLEKGEDSKQLTGVEGRKIAQPRSGRYSDVHKQQFKKMDSIANHISTWKMKIQSTATAPTASSSLKRSNSKAGLDKVESGIPHSKSFKALSKPDDADGPSGKRLKRTHNDDASQTRPISCDINDGISTTPAKTHPTALPSAVTTPTRASLARSASVKASKTSMIPSLSRSASTKTLGTPQTEGSNKYMSKMGKFSPIKSILHRSQPKFSDDPVKVAAGTHLPFPTKPTLSLNKDLPKLPSTPPKDLLRSPSVKKQVNFTPSTKPLGDISPVPSPSPSKIPRSGSMKALDSPNVTHRNTHKIPTTLGGHPGDFTFTSSKTINFGPATSGPTKTIRPVRPSGFPTPLAEIAFENHNTGATIEHGIGNKKRKHEQASSDHEEDEENIDPSSATIQSPSKRVKMGDAMTTPSKKQLVKTPKSKGKSSAGKGRGIMSLGRLNALARPKER